MRRRKTPIGWQGWQCTPWSKGQGKRKIEREEVPTWQEQHLSNNSLSFFPSRSSFYSIDSSWVFERFWFKSNIKFNVLCEIFTKVDLIQFNIQWKIFIQLVKDPGMATTTTRPWRRVSISPSFSPSCPLLFSYSNDPLVRFRKSKSCQKHLQLFL